MKILRLHPSGPLVALAAIVASLTVGLPSAATGATMAPSEASAAPTGDTGWLRLGHFSPDTKAVDVRVSALRGGTIVFELSDVGYGDVSGYTPLTQGEYAISMVAAGSNDWTHLAISDTVTVGAASATTVAAYGPNANLQLQAFSDDLTAPSAGNARIRLIQASTITPTVDVKTTTGVVIASDAPAGSATPYAEVPAGTWTLQLTGTGVQDSVDVNLSAGSITTLFVLDKADGGLTILPIVDSAAAAVVPIGGVQTGGGWLARHHQETRHAALFSRWQLAV
ncbi:DUF4397 domain-containing protein [Microbacterium deminutum]|uniref:DUF4397 domain-containing protein n=1 Tax=Microbacterium deminutum TaxID=344164 RepID=A0ABP5CJ70_9MICO